MALRRCTVRVYRWNLDTDTNGPFGVQVGPDLIVDIDDAVGTPVLTVVAVDPNPINGASYAVTAQSDGTAFDIDDTSTIMLFAAGM